MYTKSKYVTGRTHDGGLCAVIGPESIQHVSLAKVFSQVLSAGFCHAEEDDVSVYGASAGLGIKSKPEKDKALVGRAMSHPKYYD